MALLDFLKSKKVRVRFAPSPTGPLHVGGVRTALFNYIFARQNNGKFILRIEDTDKARSDKRFEQDILNGLNWMRLDHDEFYRQSERSHIYEQHIKKLLNKRAAFWCLHGKEELAEEKRKQMQNKEAPRHICEHKSKINKEGVIRLRGTDKKIKFYDLIRGEIEYNGSLLGDIVIAKNEKTPFYNLAAAIDDCEMKISHVIRGEDHIPNTPKQILIQKALGAKQPHYAHLPLILGPDKSKLSKRHGDVSVNEYKKIGYLPEALLNFMALLGWNSGDEKEIFTKEEIIKVFSIEKIQKGAAVFNIEKLNWFNKEYMKKMSVNELSKKILEYIPSEWQKAIGENEDRWQKIIELEKPRLVTLSEIKEGTEFFFNKPIFPKSLLAWKPARLPGGEENSTTINQHLDNLLKLLSNLNPDSFTAEKIKGAIWDYAEKGGRSNVLWPFRVSLTGKAKSPDPFNVAEILGKKETLERLEYAQKMLS